MSRIAPPADAGLSPAIQEIFADEARQFGAPLNTTRVWARHPGLLEAFRAWRKAMRDTTLIPPELRYLLYVRVAERLPVLNRHQHRLG